MKKFIKMGVMMTLTLVMMFQFSLTSFANNSTDRAFSFNFATNHNVTTIKFSSSLNLNKQDNSSAYVKNTGSNHFYLVDIMLDNGTYDGSSRGVFSKKYKLGRGYHGFFRNSVGIGNRALPRIEKGPSGVQWYVSGLFSPDNSAGYTDTFTNDPD